MRLMAADPAGREECVVLFPILLRYRSMWYAPPTLQLDSTATAFLRGDGSITPTLEDWSKQVKTRLQTDPGMQGFGFRSGLKEIYRKEGSLGLMRGAGSTMIGFSIQGSVKYGSYEFLKSILFPRTALPIYSGASAQRRKTRVVTIGART
jgi:hypothetical protein